MSTKDRIISAACETIADSGIKGITVGSVADRAGVSSALVHYHFDTKERLLGAAAASICSRRAATRSAAWGSGSGLATLDALWAALASGAGAGLERAWHDLAILARDDGGVRESLAAARDAELGTVAAVLPGLLRQLGAGWPVPAEELASVAIVFLDGLAAQLDEGVPADVLRTSFDAFWLVLASGGVTTRR